MNPICSILITVFSIPYDFSAAWGSPHCQHLLGPSEPDRWRWAAFPDPVVGRIRDPGLLNGRDFQAVDRRGPAGPPGNLFQLGVILWIRSIVAFSRRRLR